MQKSAKHKYKLLKAPDSDIEEYVEDRVKAEIYKDKSSTKKVEQLEPFF